MVWYRTIHAAGRRSGRSVAWGGLGKLTAAAYTVRRLGAKYLPVGSEADSVWLYPGSTG